jgi:hypothetical protein
MGQMSSLGNTEEWAVLSITMAKACRLCLKLPGKQVIAVRRNITPGSPQSIS